MKKRLFTLLLVIAIQSYAQQNFKRAKFKQENVTSFVTKKFFAFSKGKDIEKGEYVISFDIDERGEVKNIFPVKFTSRTNVVNFILAIQATSFKWEPTIIDNKAVSHKYRAVFNISKDGSFFVDSNNKAVKLVKKKSYKKALKLYSKLIQKHPYETHLYLKRSKVYQQLGQIKLSTLDSLKAVSLKNEILINTSLFSRMRKRVQSMQVRTKTIVGRDQILRREIKNQ